MPAGRIAAYGESLGSGQAVRLAAARSVVGIVLEAPLTSTIDVARRTYFWLPIGLLITDKYDNERDIRSAFRACLEERPTRHRSRGHASCGNLVAALFRQEQDPDHIPKGAVCGLPYGADLVVGEDRRMSPLLRARALHPPHDGEA